MRLERFIFKFSVSVTTIFVLCLSLGQSASAAEQNSLLARTPSIPQAGATAFARVDGPGSGGGAEFKPDTPADDSDVINAIQEAKRLVPFVLSYFESVIVNARADGSSKNLGSAESGALRIPRAVYQQLFPWPRPLPDVHDRWASAEFTIAPAMPCYDSDGAEKAASAFPFESNNICLSIPLIRANATKATVLRRVTAVLIHEIAHKAGVYDEPLAVILEEEVNKGLPDAPSRFLLHRLKTLLSDVSVAGPVRGQLATRVQSALRLIDRQADWGSICFEVASIATTGAHFGQDRRMEGYTLAILRPSLQAEEYAIRRRSSILRLYCQSEAETGPEAVASEQALVARAFPKNRTERAVNLGESGVLSIARGTWRKPIYHNHATLKAELSDILRSLQDIHTGSQAAHELLTSR